LLSLDTLFQRRKWLTAYAPLAIWIVIILGLGSQLGSMNETSRFVRPLLEFLFPNALPETLTFVHGYIRKFAHLAEYAVLGFLAFRAFAELQKARFAAALILVLAVAATDEVKQSFDPNRTASPWDVLIDIAGGAAAIILYRYYRLSRNAKRR
jgi:VanZ family protein